MRPAQLLIVAPLALLAAACGDPSRTTAPITFRGAVSGTYLPGAPGSCGPGKTTVTGAYGPDHQAQVADLTLQDDGSVRLDVHGARATYSGRGAAFRPGSGWDIDASLSNGLNRDIQVHGHLPC